MLREALWRLIARIVTIHGVRRWLIERAKRTPYTHITGKDGSVYMGRWWLFNPYPNSGGPRRWGEWLPSVRIHHIQRPDSDRHLHDHPWNARTILLWGWYQEELPATVFLNGATSRNFRTRYVGDTGRLLFGQYHRIECISDGGVWTLFITWKYRGTWGFNVDGRKVPWREYLGVK